MWKNKETMRFCFTLPYNKERDAYFISVLNNKKRMSEKGIKTVEVYKNTSVFFILIEVQYIENINIATNKLEELLMVNNSHKINLSHGLLLENIFKKPPYKNIKNENKERFKRFVMTLELENNEQLLQEYKEIHKSDNIWPQILTNMNTIGIKDMEIYLYGYQAFLIMDANETFVMEKDGETWANLPRENEWQDYVSKFQKVNPESKALEKWNSMTHIR